MREQKILITHNNPKSPISEAFRVLRTNLQFSSFDKQLKIILVTSSVVGEGKTTIVSNLAVAIAQSGRKVLLIDGDLRKPFVHKIFGVSNNKGITNLLLSEHKIYQDFIQKPEIDNLDIITSGPIPPNPSEILGSASMKEILEKLKYNYDIVLIDTPPVGTVTDAAVLSTSADGVILVLDSGRIEIKAAQRAKKLLQQVNANIIGAVLNNVNIKDRDGYYYNYYYNSEENKNKRRLFKKKRKRDNQLLK